MTPFGLQLGDISPVDSSNVWAIGCPRGDGECSNLVHTTNGGHGWSKLPIK